MITTTAPACFAVAYSIITFITWAMITPYMVSRMSRQLHEDSLLRPVVVAVVAALGLIPALLWPIVIPYCFRK